MSQDETRSLEEQGQIWRSFRFVKSACEEGPYTIRLTPCGHVLEVVGREPQYIERCMECEDKRLEGAARHG